jgi:CRISPR/Cas system CSM-associated protein Csm2 small subunit
MMAPHIEAARQKEEVRQREEESRSLVAKPLPAKRKLKAVKERLSRVIELQVLTFSDDAHQAIAHIRQMPDDDERYSECKTLQQYVVAVVEYHKQQTSS